MGYRVRLWFVHILERIKAQGQAIPEHWKAYVPSVGFDLLSPVSPFLISCFKLVLTSTGYTRNIIFLRWKRMSLWISPRDCKFPASLVLACQVHLPLPRNLLLRFLHLRGLLALHHLVCDLVSSLYFLSNVLIPFSNWVS